MLRTLKLLPSPYNRRSVIVMHPFAYFMIFTFLAALATMLAGVAGMGSTGNQSRSTNLMALRVGLCGLLLAEILIYINFIR